MATKLMRINIEEYFETDLIAKIKTTYGYNYTLSKVYHNENDIANEKVFPFIRYYLGDETRTPKNVRNDLFDCETTLHIFGNVKGTIQTANNNSALILAEQLSEDLQGYFENGNWITSGKGINLIGVKYSYGMVKECIITEISRPYLKSDNNYEVYMKVNIKYQQDLKTGF